MTTDKRSARDVLVALTVGVVALAGVAYEIAGLTEPGRHTISYTAHRVRALRVLILFLFLFGGIGGAIWWWWHSSQAIPR